MAECECCINALPTLMGCRKRRVDMQWPADYECLMEMNDFPEAHDCEWHIETPAGGFEQI